MCPHYWADAGSLDHVKCRVCGLQLKRAGDDPDGTWQLWKVALRAAMRSKTQAAVLA